MDVRPGADKEKKVSWRYGRKGLIWLHLFFLRSHPLAEFDKVTQAMPGRSQPFEPLCYTDIFCVVRGDALGSPRL